MERIEIDSSLLTNFTDAEIQALAERYNCLAEKKKGSWIFETDDAINFYWLGMNMAYKVKA